MSKEKEPQLVFLLDGSEIIGYTNITDFGHLEIETPRIIAFDRDEDVVYFYAFSPLIDEEEQSVLLFQSNSIITTATPSKPIIKAYIDMLNVTPTTRLKLVEEKKPLKNVVQFNLPDKGK